MNDDDEVIRILESGSPGDVEFDTSVVPADPVQLRSAVVGQDGLAGIGHRRQCVRLADWANRNLIYPV